MSQAKIEIALINQIILTSVKQIQTDLVYLRSEKHT
jgi:hypothetical protein